MNYSVYVVIVEGDGPEGFEALSDVTTEGPEEVARDVPIEEARDLVRVIRDEHR